MLSSIRNFFLALFISLIVFGISAYFLVGFIDRNINEMSNPEDTTNASNGEDANGEDTANGEDEEPIDTSVFTALILGIDDGKSQHDEKQEADTIILININSKTQTFMISSLPCDMKTEIGGFVLRLGAVYSEFDSGMLIQAVRAYTGLQADYLCVFDYESIEKVFDVLGDVQYDIPMDMYYEPKPYYIYDDEEEIETEPATEPQTQAQTQTKSYDPIDLKSGMQKINGEQAVQLLRYRSYSNGNFDRMITQVDFIKEIIRQKITFENLANSKRIYTEIKNSIVETNMDEKDFESYAETIFSISEYTIKEVAYPGIVRNENGIAFFSPDIKSAVNRYMEYRKDRQQSREFDL